MIEKSIIGAMISDPECIDEVLSIVTPVMFAEGKTVLQAIVKLHSDGDPINAVTVADLTDKSAYIAECTSLAPGSSAVSYHASQLRERWLIGRQEFVKYRITDAENDGAGSEAFAKIYTEALDEIEGNAGDLYHTARVAVFETVDLIQRLKANKGELLGVPSGIGDLDRMTDGFQAEDFIVIGARPSQGKTALGLKIVHHCAVDLQIPAAIISLEMSRTSLIQRMASMGSHIPLSMIRRPGMLGGDDDIKVSRELERISNAPMYIYDTPNDDLYSIISVARRLRRVEGIRVLVVDYLSLINVRGPDPRHEKVAHASRTLKSLARDLKIPIIVLSQLTRDVDGHEPRLNSIRESGAVEQDADVVIFIHESNEDHSRKLKVAKQRNGPTGTIAVSWNGSCTLFSDLARDEEYV